MRAPASKPPPPEARTEGAGASRPLPDDALIIVPVRNVVLFPGMVFPLTVGRERSRAAVHEAARLQRPLGVLLQSKPDADLPGPDDLHWVGTTANVLRYITAADGAHHAICQGVQRFRVLQFLEGYPFMAARVELIAETGQAGPDIEGRAQGLRERAAQILELLPQVPEEVVTALQGVEGAPRLADFIAGLMDIGAEEKQALLETFDLRARLDKLLDLLAHRIEVLKVSREIAERTKGSIDDSQRKHLLREQMRTIQKELGEGDEGAAEIAELERAIAAAGMPAEVEKQARKELKRLERMPEGAGEYSMIRTYLDWLIELPWAAGAEAAIDIAEARRILDDGSLRPRQDQEAHSRISRGPQAQSVGQKPDPVFCRPARRGQDVARPEHRQGDRAAVRALEPGRRARRGGNPRSPAHVHRFAARQHHPERAQGGHAQLRADAGRSRQARRRRLSRRPRVGAARSARPRAERGLPRQLSGGAVRPLGGDVHLHGERARHDTGPAARPDGGHSAAGLYGAGEAADRAALSRRAPARGDGPHRGAVRDRRRRADGDHRRLHAGGRRAQSRARDRQRLPQCRGARRRRRRAAGGGGPR